MTGTLPQLSANDANNPNEMLAIQNLIKDSLTQKLTSKRKQKTKNDLHEALIATLQEFSSCFMLVGFDLENDPIIISRAQTPLEGEALISLVKKVYADVAKR